jgi:4'-phosphopantetheinyl transferase
MWRAHRGRSARPGTIQVLDRLVGTAPFLPSLLVTNSWSAADRRSKLAALAAHVLQVSPAEVVVKHGDGQAPHLVRPAGTGLHLSSGSRGGVAALGIAPARIGVDVEAIEAGAPPPWNVLHPREAEALRCAPDAPTDFAALWVVKEAYLKALGTGLSQEPSSIAIRLSPVIAVDDPDGPTASVTLLRRGRLFVAAVLLDR